MKKNIAILLLFISVQLGHAATWKAKGLGVDFQLRFHGTHLEYKGHHSQLSFVQRECSAGILKHFRQRLMGSLSKQGTLRPGSKLTVEIDSVKREVDPYSRFGSLLISMDDEMRRLKISEYQVCAR